MLNSKIKFNIILKLILNMLLSSKYSIDNTLKIKLLKSYIKFDLLYHISFGYNFLPITIEINFTRKLFLLMGKPITYSDI